MKKVISGFMEEIRGSASTPAGENIFQVCDQNERVKLDNEQA